MYLGTFSKDFFMENGLFADEGKKADLVPFPKKSN